MCPEGWRGASTGHIHRLGVYTGSGVYGQSRHHANLPDTFSSKKVLGVEQCWACCSTAWTAGSGYTPNRCIPPTGVYPQPVYTPVGGIHRLGVYTQPVYMASRSTTPTFRTHSLLKKFWVWSNVGHAAQQRGRPVRGIPPTGVYPEPAVHAVEQHAQHCSTPKTFLEENVSGRLAWCFDWPYTPVGCIHRFRCIHPRGYTPNRPSTLLSSMPNIAPHPNFFRKECVWKVGVVP